MIPGSYGVHRHFHDDCRRFVPDALPWPLKTDEIRSWDSFVWSALTAVLLWAAGAFFAWKERKPLVYACTLTGIALFFAFILGMWISLERPPLRTMGETRLWYSSSLPVAGITVQPLALQMDPEFQYAALLRVHLWEPAQTGHSLQESDAGPAESLVRAARHRYVLPCAAGR